MHRVDISLVNRRGPDVIFIFQSYEQVASAGGAVPHRVLVLPILAQFARQVVLRQLHPLTRGEKRPLALPHILRHELVAAHHNVVPILTARRAVVAIPKPLVRLAPVSELRPLAVKQPHLIDAAVKLIVVLA